MLEDPLRIVGAPGSPYSRKMRALLRYRRIAYAWSNLGSPESRDLPQPKVALIPQLILPGAGGKPEARMELEAARWLLEEAQSISQRLLPGEPVTEGEESSEANASLAATRVKLQTTARLVSALVDARQRRGA